MNERLVRLIILCVSLLAGAGARAEELELIKDTSSAPTDAQRAGESRSQAAKDEAGQEPQAADTSAKDLQELLDEREQAQPAGARRIAFSFSNISLATAGRELSQLAGVGVSIISDPKSPPPLAERRVSLTMGNVELTDALDWLMRQVDGVYTAEGKSVCIASAPEQLDIDPLVRRVYPLRTMRRFDRPQSGVPDLVNEQMSTFLCVKTCLAEHLRERPEATLAISPDRMEFVAVCTAAAHRRIREVLREFALNDRPPQPLPGPDAAASKALLDALNAKLDRTVRCDFDNRPVTKIVAELGIQADVNIGLDPRELPEGEAMAMTLDAGKVPLKLALDAIVNRCGFASYSLERGRGIWLNGRRHYRYSGRSPWEGWLIRSYFVGPLAGKLSPPRLMAFVRENVTPGEWSGLLPAMAYAPSGRLIVFHRQDAHRELEEYLHRLQKQVGSGALDSRRP